MFIKDLRNGYTIREMPAETFWPEFDKHSKTIFMDNATAFMWRQHISDEEKENLKTLGKNMGAPLIIRLGLFHGEEFVGWTFGDQQSGDTYYMRNSAIVESHRRKGLYTALLTTKLDLLKERGFQKIYSRHNATNNAVIIPKLKVGFTIAAMEVDDMFGTLVHLTYLTNPLRRQVMIFRTGDLKPDQKMKEVLGMS